MLSRLMIVAAVAGCHGDDPGFDVVRVPQTAYATPDGGGLDASDAAHVATRDGGREPAVVCIPELEEEGNTDDVSEDFPKCLLKHETRTFDSRATTRHRKKDDESEVCCYKR
jgi:hypothetical protein